MSQLDRLQEEAIKASLRLQGEREHLATKAEVNDLRAEFFKNRLARAEWIAILVPTTLAALVGVAAYVG